MGADYIDYTVVDPVVCPPQNRQFYTEKLLYMPHSYLANSFRHLHADIFSNANDCQAKYLASRAAHQLPESAFVFCNFCRLGRITPDLFRVWMNILKCVENSVLCLSRTPNTVVARIKQATQE